MLETVMQAEQVLWCATHNCGRPKSAPWDRYYKFEDVVCVEYSIRVAAPDPRDRPKRCRMLEALLVPSSEYRSEDGRLIATEPWLPDR